MLAPRRQITASHWLYVTLCFFSLASVASTESSGEDLREVLRSKECFTGRKPVYPFQDERMWVFEVNDWTSHKLTTAIAAIVLKEHAGYGVDLNHVPSGSGVYQRVAKEAVEGTVMQDYFNQERDVGYANLEVWPAGQRDPYTKYVTNKGVAKDSGSVGYDGRSGWYVGRQFAEDRRHGVTPEFYRAYDRTNKASISVIEALLENSFVECGAPRVCSSGSTVDCQDMDHVEAGLQVEWCPAKVDGPTPAVLSRDPFIDQGFNEEISQSNGMSFAMRFVGQDRFRFEAFNALKNGSAQVVHLRYPSTTHSRLQWMNVPISRVMLPSENCGIHRLDGKGDWACDFPLQNLFKLVSMDIAKDPVMSKFFRKFSIPSGNGMVPTGDLQGGGIREMMVALLAKLEVGTSPAIERPATAKEIFDIACAWVKANEKTGVRWEYWVQDRDVPFFADTLHWSFPFPLLAVMGATAMCYIVFLEWPWLHTTLLPSQAKRIMARTEGKSRTALDVILRVKTRKVTATGSASPCIGRDIADGIGKKGSFSPEMGSFTPKASPMSFRSSSEEVLGFDPYFWIGLSQRAFEKPEVQAFWGSVDAWAMAVRKQKVLPSTAPPPDSDYVFLAHHIFPCLQVSRRASIPIIRSQAGAMSGRTLEVEVLVEECEGGAKRVKDFHAGTHRISFAPGQDHHILHIPIRHNKDLWQNSYWFRVRLSKVVSAQGMLASPAQANVLVLDEDAWPANIPPSKRGGAGISLMRYFIYAERKRRGEKWRKTMIAMCWKPVHSVFISTLVQKILVDHVVKGIQETSSSSDGAWFYGLSFMLVLVQLLSLGLNRWADVVQTRSRGRTGGIRQHHRGELLRKYMHMEHSEHWLASDASWLYASIFDADVITGQAYFSVFVLAESIVALSLSVLLVVGLAFWAYAKSRTSNDASSISPGSWQSIWYILGVFLIIPLGAGGVWCRRHLTWAAVIARKDLECAWFKSCTWIITNWRLWNAFSATERVALEKRVLKQNAEFIPAHWDARDTMNDTAWVTHWIQGVGYCMMLIIGLFELCEYTRFGIGAMEVGTFYALCSIYLSVGKYTGVLSNVFVDMQRAIVSLREIAALSNQMDQRSQRREARKWENVSRAHGKTRLLQKTLGHLQYPPGLGISFADGLYFVRPPQDKVGSTFAEIRLRECTIPLGDLVYVTAKNERVLRTFLGLASQVIHPTDEFGDELPDEWEGVTVPYGLKVLMLPTGNIGMGATAPTLIEQLEFTGAPKPLCKAMAEAAGLDPARETDSLGTGSMQVFSIVRAVLLDPDVLCAFRPLSIVPMDMQKNMHLLLRLWQGGGGLPAVANFLGVPIAQETPLYRPNRRTLVVGNPELGIWGGYATDVHLDLDALLWKPSYDEINLDIKTSTSETLRRRGDSWIALRSTVGVTDQQTYGNVRGGLDDVQGRAACAASSSGS